MMSCCSIPTDNNEKSVVRKMANLWIPVVGIILYFIAVFSPKSTEILYIYIISYILLGWGVIKQSLCATLKKDFFNENTLMTIATLGAFFLKEYPEAVGVMLFYRVGEYIQNKAVETSKSYIHDLFKLESFQALVLSNGSWEEMDPKSVDVGSIILVRKGEKIPLDGVVMRGNSLINTSSLTGESVPVSVKEGSLVFSGTINEGDSIEIQVSKLYENSSMQRLIQLIDEANKNKAPIVKFITRFAHKYTPIVFTIAFLLVFIPVVFFGADWREWLNRSVILLVISCPCALILSPPLGFFCGLGMASRQGILVKSGEQLQLLVNLKNIIFDKTGTITYGNFVLQNFWVSDKSKEQWCFRVLAMMESSSSHPIANAIISAYNTRYGSLPKTDFPIEELPGKGLKAIIEGQEILAGSKQLLRDFDVSVHLPPDIPVGTLVYVAVNRTLVAIAAISDSLKPTSISALQELSKKYSLTILSGDNKRIVGDIAEKVGIKDYHAELLPEEKLHWVQNIKQSGVTMFIGDGINDAPSLGVADIGVAMGQKGADISIESADIVLSKDDLTKIPSLIHISQRTLQITKQNIALALIVKIIVMVFTLFALTNMWEGIFADVGVTLITIFNALRIFQKK